MLTFWNFTDHGNCGAKMLQYEQVSLLRLKGVSKWT